MNEFFIAFLTGLTTGGLSCLAVQGGLLAGSLAAQIEKDISSEARYQKSPALARPIILFLTSKLFFYTLLGALLGYLGSVFQLSPTMRAVLLFAIGVFLLGNALRMLNVHPIFRYFAFEPPAFLTRFIRRKSKNGDQTFTPIFLGSLTILIPCGVTQAMMALSMASGSAIQGAGLMFAFTLGTSPVFFAVTYFASRLGARIEGAFVRIVAVVILILGMVSIESGLNLIGSPVSIQRLIRNIQSSQSMAALSTPVTPLTGTGPFLPTATLTTQEGAVNLSVINSGYTPAVLHAPGGKAFTLNLVTNNTQSCSRAFVIPALNIQELLPETGTVSVAIPAQPKGSVLQFACSMGMYSGEIVFD